jgi:hypothetical protein
MIVVVAAGCGGSGVHAQTPSGTTDPTPSIASPTPQSEEQQAGAAAVTQVIRYEQLLDDLALHPSRSLNQLYAVATQPDVTDEIGFLNRFRGSHDRQTGRGRVISTKVDAVDLQGATTKPTARVTICLYVGDVRAYDRSGKSIVPKSRKPYYLTHLTLVNVKYPAPSGWLVERVSATEEPSCK